MPSSVSDIVKAVTNSREEYQPTLGWDVVVNYSAKEINKLLEASYKNDTTPGHLKRLSVPVTGMNEDGDPYEIKYNFDIAPPLIQFEALGSAPYCSLTFHINGGTVETSKKSWAVTAGVYKIVVSNLSLATMSGAEGDEPIPIESKKPFDFPNDRPGVGVVTLDLKGSVEKMIVKVSSTPGSDPPHVPQIDNHLGDLQQKILEYFVDPERATSIRYHLARVDSTPPPKGSVSLVPKSFRFATYSLESDPDAPTILSIFIRVTKVHHGEEDVLQSAWTSLWAVQYRVPPIPASHTASIIFNYRLLEEALLLPAFDVHGLKYTTDKHTYAIQTGQNQKQPYWRDPTAKAPYSNRYVGEFEVNFGKEPLKLQLEQPERGAAVGTLKWRNDFEFQWGWSDWDGRRTYSGSGAATVTNTLAKSARFSLTDYTLALDASFGSGDWHRDIRVKDKSFWDKLCGGNGNSGVPPTVKDCLPPSPSLSLDFGSLYYFFVTNLLCPTQKVIDIDTNVGLLLPRDFYVVGSIASKRDIVARISAAGRAPAAIHAPEPHEASSIASSTKVGRLWQTLHTKNDLATSVISSVAKNDREGFLDALDEAGLSASSFTFTDDEHKAFMSGYTPSGELELTVWGGYYETDALPSGEVYGLIVVSNKNQVFWGGRNIASDPEEVSYTLAADGTLSFETKAGPVRLSFERNYSLEDGTISSSRFKGTIGDVALSGRLEKLPFDDTPTPNTLDTFGGDTSALETHLQDDSPSPIVNAADDKKWSKLVNYNNTVTVLDWVGRGVMVYQVFLWCRGGVGAAARARALQTALANTQLDAYKIASRLLSQHTFVVDYKGSGDAMSHLTKQSLNGFMHHLGVDFTKMPVDAALALLRGPASQFFTAEATAYARQAINATVLELTLHFQTWDPNYYQEWVRSQSDPKAKEHATRFMQTYFDTAKDPYLWDSFTGEALMAELKEQYRKAGALAQSARDTATLERDAALKVIQAHDREVKEIQDRLNHDKTDPRSPEEVAKDHQRRAELDKELADEHKKVTDRQTEIDQREGERVRHDKDATDAEQRRKEQADRWKNKLDKVKH